MISSIEEFVQLLTDSGLMTAAEVFAHQDSLPPKRRPVSAEALAKSLVDSEKLTAYQSTQLLKGRYEGLVLGDYVILEKIGGGGMGDVFKALHSRMNRIVALKTLPPRSIEAWEGTARFKREIEAAAKLDHPNIVAAHDAREARNIHFLVMQYIDGRDLHAIVNDRGALAFEDAIGLVLQVARGLHYAHAQHVIHRDIKPSNILVDRSGTAKIVDMGLALLREASPTTSPARQLTQDGEAMGTADFMSPEQAKDAHRADERSDIYSLGCTLYFLLTGKSPYRSESVVKTLESHERQRIPSIRRDRPDVPRELETVFKKMVAKKPQSRYQSMSEVLEALAVFAPVAQPALSGAGSSGVSIDPQETKAYVEADSVATFLTSATSRDETYGGGKRPSADTKPMSRNRRIRLAVLICSLLLAIAAVALIVWEPWERPGRPLVHSGLQPLQPRDDNPELLLEPDAAILLLDLDGMDDWFKLAFRPYARREPVFGTFAQRTYEAERDFIKKGGRVETSGWAFDPEVTADGKKLNVGFNLHGPYVNDIPAGGPYEAIVRIKTGTAEVDQRDTLEVVNFEVYDANSKITLAQFRILEKDLQPLEIYHEIPLRFYCPEAASLEFRFWYNAISKVTIDRVTIVRAADRVQLDGPRDVTPLDLKWNVKAYRWQPDGESGGPVTNDFVGLEPLADVKVPYLSLGWPVSDDAFPIITRSSTSLNLPPGNYRLIADAGGAMRVRVNGATVIDDWSDAHHSAVRTIATFKEGAPQNISVDHASQGGPTYVQLLIAPTD